MNIIVLSTRWRYCKQWQFIYKQNCSVIFEHFLFVCVLIRCRSPKSKSTVKLFSMSLQSSHMKVSNACSLLFFMCLPPPRIFRFVLVAQQVEAYLTDEIMYEPNRKYSFVWMQKYKKDAMHLYNWKFLLRLSGSTNAQTKLKSLEHMHLVSVHSDKTIRMKRLFFLLRLFFFLFGKYDWKSTQFSWLFVYFEWWHCCLEYAVAFSIQRTHEPSNCNSKAM